MPDKHRHDYHPSVDRAAKVAFCLVCGKRTRLSRIRGYRTPEFH